MLQTADSARLIAGAIDLRTARKFKAILSLPT
jgi:hypothetical protein